MLKEFRGIFQCNLSREILNPRAIGNCFEYPRLSHWLGIIHISDGKMIRLGAFCWQDLNLVDLTGI